MISILFQLATRSRDQPLIEVFSRVFSSPRRSAQLIWTAVGRTMPLPILVAPTAGHPKLHRDGENETH